MEATKQSKIDQINKKYDMALLLKQIGCVVEGQVVVHCPFHSDKKKSACFYPHDNALFCFAEHEMFRSWDVLKSLGVSLEVAWDGCRGLPCERKKFRIKEKKKTQVLLEKKRFLKGESSVYVFLEALIADIGKEFKRSGL